MAKKTDPDLEAKISYLEKSLADSHGLYGIRIAELNSSIAEKNRVIDRLINELASIKVSWRELDTVLSSHREMIQEAYVNKIRKDFGL